MEARGPSGSAGDGGGLLPLQCGPHCFLEAEFPLRAAWPLAGWWQITHVTLVGLGKWKRHGDQARRRGRAARLRPRSRSLRWASTSDPSPSPSLGAAPPPPPVLTPPKPGL